MFFLELFISLPKLLCVIISVRDIKSNTISEDLAFVQIQQFKGVWNVRTLDLLGYFLKDKKNNKPNTQTLMNRKKKTRDNKKKHRSRAAG